MPMSTMRVVTSGAVRGVRSDDARAASPEPPCRLSRTALAAPCRGRRSTRLFAPPLEERLPARAQRRGRAPAVRPGSRSSVAFYSASHPSPPESRFLPVGASTQDRTHVALATAVRYAGSILAASARADKEEPWTRRGSKPRRRRLGGYGLYPVESEDRCVGHGP